jgi:hypothetical protein
MAPVVPALDLYEIAKAQAWRKLWVSIGLSVGGLVLSVVGLAAGFIVFFGIILLIAGIVAFFSALAYLTDPTRALTNLAPHEAGRRQVLRMVDAELSQPTTSTLRTTKGTALLGAAWVAYHDKSALLVSRREDILMFYIATRRNNQSVKVHLRSGQIVEIEITGADHHLLQGLAYALPHAIAGFDPRWTSMPVPMLAQEVDRRRMMGGY